MGAKVSSNKHPESQGSPMWTQVPGSQFHWGRYQAQPLTAQTRTHRPSAVAAPRVPPRPDSRQGKEEEPSTQQHHSNRPANRHAPQQAGPTAQSPTWGEGGWGAGSGEEGGAWPGHTACSLRDAARQGSCSARLSDPSWGLCPLLSPCKAWAPAGDTPSHPVRQLVKEAETAGGHWLTVSGCPR